MFKLGISFLIAALAVGCSARINPVGDRPSPTDPAPRSDAEPAPIRRPSESPATNLPEKDWKSDLAVRPGTSLEEGQEQVIRFVSKKDFREFEGKFWIAGKGFAMVNGADDVYFWGSPNPPPLEVEVSDGSKEVFDTCKKVARGDFKNNRMLFLEGEGFFEEMPTARGSLGVFKVFKISKCRLGSPKDFNKNSK